MDMLAQMDWGTWFLAVLIFGVCLFLIIVVLLQRGRGGGLAGAFGGGGGSSAFGAKTGDVFTWITVVLAAVFILLACVGNFVFDRSARDAAVATPATVPSTAPSTTDSAPINITPEGSVQLEAIPTGDGPINVPAGGGPVPIKVTPSGTVQPADSAAPQPAPADNAAATDDASGAAGDEPAPSEKKEDDSGGSDESGGGGEDR